MQDMFKNLSAQQLAKLMQLADGGDQTPDGGTLHAEKNAPWVNGMYSNIKFPPYVFQPYPKTLFNAQYLKADEQYRAALALRSRRGYDDDRERIVNDATATREACMRIVQGPEEERLLGSLWCETPALAVEAQEKSDRAIAEAAAASNWDDRNMSALAHRERAAADETSEGHLVEVPRTRVAPRDPVSHRRKSHHKKKTTPVAADAAEVTP